MATLEAEIKTYNEKLPELLKHVGKYVLIHDGKIVDFYDSYADALRVAYSRADPGEFLVKRVAPAEQVAFFTRDIGGECPV